MNKSNSIILFSESKERILKPSIFKIWLFFYVFSLSTAILIQFIFLPKLFSAYNNGSGLIVGTDSCLYHKIALKQYHKIKEEGWAAINLKPENHIMGGIATILYVLISPRPWSLLPLNAGLFSLSIVLLIMIIEEIFHYRIRALVSILPFCCFPTSMLIFSQINKDCIFIPGVLCLLLSWVIIERPCYQYKSILKNISIFLLLNFVGLLMCYLVRSYFLEVYRALFLFLIFFFLIFKICSKKKDTIKNIWLYVIAFAICYTFFLIEFNAEKDTFSVKESNWEWNELIPDLIENKFVQIVQLRNGYYTAYQYAGSNIDEEMKINSMADFIYYIPRAINIAILSPFPNFWLKKAYSEGGKIRRIVSAVEMSIIYFLFSLLPVVVYCWRLKIELWTILIFCVFISTIFAIAVPNLGSFYRMRYSFEMTIAVLSFAGILELVYRLYKSKMKNV